MYDGSDEERPPAGNGGAYSPPKVDRVTDNGVDYQSRWPRTSPTYNQDENRPREHFATSHNATSGGCYEAELSPRHGVEDIGASRFTPLKQSSEQLSPRLSEPSAQQSSPRSEDHDYPSKHRQFGSTTHGNKDSMLKESEFAASVFIQPAQTVPMAFTAPQHLQPAATLPISSKPVIDSAFTDKPLNTAPPAAHHAIDDRLFEASPQSHSPSSRPSIEMFQECEEGNVAAQYGADAMSPPKFDPNAPVMGTFEHGMPQASRLDVTHQTPTEMPTAKPATEELADTSPAALNFLPYRAPPIEEDRFFSEESPPEFSPDSMQSVNGSFPVLQSEVYESRELPVLPVERLPTPSMCFPTPVPTSGLPHPPKNPLSVADAEASPFSRPRKESKEAPNAPKVMHHPTAEEERSLTALSVPVYRRTDEDVPLPPQNPSYAEPTRATSATSSGHASFVSPSTHPEIIKTLNPAPTEDRHDKMRKTETFASDFGLVPSGTVYDMTCASVHKSSNKQDPNPPLSSWSACRLKLPSDASNRCFSASDRAGLVPMSKWDFIKQCWDLVKTTTDLETAIRLYNPTFSDRNWSSSFSCLHKLGNVHKGFTSSTLRYIITMASELPYLVSQAPPLLKPQTNATVILSQKQCVSLVANMFLCSFPRRLPRHWSDSPNEHQFYPDIHFASLFSSSKDQSLAKLKCIAEYFNFHEQNPSEDNPVEFTRRAIDESQMPVWRSLKTELLWSEIQRDGGIEDVKDAWHADFANKYIGGGVLGEGCVQEEIRFCISPELFVSRLICAQMDENESILITGSKRYTNYTGYSDSFRFDGAISRDEILRSKEVTIVAFDALAYLKDKDPQLQFEAKDTMRELEKCVSAFSYSDPSVARLAIATGKWGCGAFNGNVGWKYLIQWVAASAIGRPLVFCCAGDRNAYKALEAFNSAITELNPRIDEIYELMAKFSEKSAPSSGSGANQRRGDYRGSSSAPPSQYQVLDFVHRRLERKRNAEREEARSAQRTREHRASEQHNSRLQKPAPASADHHLSHSSRSHHHQHPHIYEPRVQNSVHLVQIPISSSQVSYILPAEPRRTDRQPSTTTSPSVPSHTSSHTSSSTSSHGRSSNYGYLHHRFR